MKKIYIHPGNPPEHKPPLPTNNVFRVRLGGLLEQQRCYCLFYYADDAELGTASRADLFEVANLFASALGVVPAIAAASSDALLLDRVMVECPTSPTLAAIENEEAQPGLILGGALPSTVAVTMAKRTFFRGKAGRGRVSLPGVPEASVTGSTLTIPADYNVVAGKMIAKLIGGTKQYRPGLYAPDKLYAGSGTEPIKVFHSWVDLTSVVAMLTLGTARRRKIGRGI